MVAPVLIGRGFLPGVQVVEVTGLEPATSTMRT